MANLCSEGRAGWLLSSHISWLLNKANELQKTSFCFCLSTTSQDLLRRITETRNVSEVQQLVVIANVGKNPDSSVYLATPKKSGNHWVVITVDLTDSPNVNYCDSLGWNIPPNLLKVLVGYTQHFGLPMLKGAWISFMHAPSALDCSHKCAASCKNYPVQECGSVCGVIASICAVLAALDNSLFRELTGIWSGPRRFLHEPTKYEKYLRRVLICWFITDNIDLSLLGPKPENTSTHFGEHAYSCEPKILLKRKAAEPSQTKQKHAHYSIIVDDQFHIKTIITATANPITINQIDSITNNLVNPRSHCKVSLQNIQSQSSSTCTNTQIQGNFTDTTCSQKCSDTTSLQVHTNMTTETYANNNKPHSNINTKAKTELPNTQGCCNLKDKITTDQNHSKKTYICAICNLTLSCRQALSRHKKRKHKGKIAVPQRTCHCHMCSEFKSCTIRELIAHYKNKHQQDVNIGFKTFRDDKEFQQWKKEIEKETSSQYIKTHGSIGTNQCIITYYYCHRSGTKKVVADHKRSRKSKGSCKMGNKCTAFMIARKDVFDMSITVEYCLQHIGHSFKLGHQTISDDLRSFIGGKLSQGVEPGKILDDINDRITEVNRDSIVTRKDIHNIKDQYNISQTQKHRKDGQSVDLWVQELRKEADDPIIFYKPQNTPHDVINNEDFLLCIQTVFQRKMMIKHASKMVCVDSTQRRPTARRPTAKHDFLLTTILILDEFEEAVPVAWAISNREDSEILQFFMDALKVSCGKDFITEIFMSDLADNLYNAWCVTFSKPVKRLYCSWHVDENWQNKIHECMRVQEDQCNAYAFLKTLQSETDEANFCKMLQEFLSCLKNISPSFLEYFTQNYVIGDKKLFWAACFCIGKLANTNMFTEAFHSVLKDIHFNRKQNKRVDSLLIILLKLARDKAIDHLIKSRKGRVGHCLREIRIRHKTSESVVGIQKCSGSSEEWIVPSSTVECSNYCIKRVKTDTCDCKLVCDLCHVCEHMYTCTCVDFLVKSLSCKHIHAIHTLRNESRTSQKQMLPDDEDCQDVESLDLINTVICQDKPEVVSDADRLRRSALSKSNDIMDLIHKTTNIDTLRAVVQSLQEIHMIGCGMQHTEIVEQKTKFPSNKKFESQGKRKGKK